MGFYEFEGLNHALWGMAKELYINGMEFSGRENSAGSKTKMMPEPVLIKIKNPRARYLMVPERKWNPILPYSESLWLASGGNVLDEGPGYYVKSLYNFSDDGNTWSGGYGPRIRFYGQNLPHYKISLSEEAPEETIDQLKYVVNLLKENPETRQATITIADPQKDIPFKTKDYPCTRELIFRINLEGKLDMTTTMRSNDLWWGFSAVNVFNFTYMQEYISGMLGVEIGSYFHIVNNFHYYSNFEADIERLIQAYSEQEVIALDRGSSFIYREHEASLESFDENILELRRFEEYLKNRDSIDSSVLKSGLNSLKNSTNDYFYDWGLMLAHGVIKKRFKENSFLILKDLYFVNTTLNSLMKGEMK